MSDKSPLREIEVALDNAPESSEYDEKHITVYARTNEEAAEKAYERADKAYPEYANADVRICGSRLG